MSEVVFYDQDGQATRFAVDDDGKRPILRNYRATNASDTGRIRRAIWELATNIGYSRESTSGALACDYAQDMETRFPRRLFSKGARTAITLTTADPPGVANTAKLGQFKLGSLAHKLGGAVTTTDSVTHFAEQYGYLFAFRGRLATVIQISNWTVLGTSILPEAVQGATSWYGKVRVGLGSNANMRTLVGVSASGATWEETHTLLETDVYAGPLAVGSDRCWFVTKSTNGELENLLSYTSDDFQTTASPFVVGDPKVRANGIGPLGPFTFVGLKTNLYSFTDQGKPVPLSRALIGHSSEHNGATWADPGWGWNYAITDIGLRACTSHIDNPVGPGESMRTFTGHGGRPTALWAERGELFVVYQSGADLYAYRCTFGPETANTGQPLFYPWWYKASSTCQAVFSTNTPTDTAMVWGEGTNMAYETISRDGRDDLLSTRTYDTGGGTWYGTTRDAEPNLLKVMRLARLHTKGLTAGSSWTLAMSFDGGTYLDIETLTTNDHHTLRPVETGVPLDSIAGYTLKPRLTQVAAGSGASTTPPEIDGVLEIEYDERPAYVTEVALTINIGKTQGLSMQGVVDRLEALMNAQTTGPIKIRLPDEDIDRYGMVQAVSNRRDLVSGGVEGIDVMVQLWDTA